MPSGLEDKALRAIVNKDTKELCKVVYELEAGDYLVVAKKSYMTFAISNSQYI